MSFRIHREEKIHLQSSTVFIEKNPLIGGLKPMLLKENCKFVSEVLQHERALLPWRERIIYISAVLLSLFRVAKIHISLVPSLS